MAKAAKKAKITVEEPVQDIFTQLGMAETPSTEPGATVSAPKGDEKGGTAALEARLEAMQRDLTRLERTNQALMTQTPQYVVPGGEKTSNSAPQVDMSGLPDPDLDREGYHKALTEKIVASVTASAQKAADQRAQEQLDQRANAQRTETLWNEFAEAHPDLAEHRDLVEVAANRVIQRATQKGMDANKYMFTASDQFISDVAEETKKRFGVAIEALAGKDGEEEVEESAEPAHIREARAAQANRTAGVPGGAAPGGARPGDTVKNGDMLSDLAAMQRKLNLY